MIPLFSVLSVSENRTASCTITNDGFKLTDDIDLQADAYAIYDDSIDKNGWYQLHVVGNKAASPINMMRCAGIVEGYLSHKDIYNHFKLICDIKGFPRNATSDEERYSAPFIKFMKTNYRYIVQSIDAYPESDYWTHVSYIFEQIKGINEGYNYAPSHGYMSPLDHWVLQSEGDLGDITRLLARRKESSSSAGPTQQLMAMDSGDPESLGGHCTGLIRVLDDYSDIYFAHDAWSDYRDLHGQLKEYYFPIEGFKAKRLSLSTRPGKISSYDDFYLADSGLMVLETTMSIFNESLYDYVDPKSISTWFRAALAMWTTNNGPDWIETFMKHNLGTYNNQYVIIDTNKFERFQRPGKDFIWVVEQVPGPFWQKEDVTEYVLKQGYWPSINKPHSKFLFDLMGYPEKIKQNPKTALFYTYETSACYRLMEREVPFIKDFETFKSFMRYNNWKRDTYSNGDASQMIMSRYDQRRPGDIYGPAKAFGGLDTKAAKFTDYKTKMMFDAIASPSNEHNPNWKFDDKFPEAHDGLPQEWNFSWVRFRSVGYDACNFTQKECEKAPMCGWCMYNQQCMPGDSQGPFEFECDAGWTVYHPMQSFAIPVIITTTIVVFVFCGFVLACHLVGKRRRNQ